MTLGGIIELLAIITLLSLVEYPSDKGLSIKEEGKFSDPS